MFYNNATLKHNANNIYVYGKYILYESLKRQGDKLMAKVEVPLTKEIDAAVLEGIIESIKSLQYGTVTITVHDGKVTQIETSRKQRFS